MKLYLVRHAIAADRGTQYPDDSKRPLTEQGMSRFTEVVKGIAALGVKVDLILASPFTRALQTAEILSEGLPGHPAIEETQSLTPDTAPQHAIKILVEYGEASAIAIVGHRPGIGRLAAALIGARDELPFKKGGVCRVDFDESPRAGGGELRWFATPKMLRRLR